MEILFENVYTDTEENMLELYRQGGRVGRWIYMVIFACYAVFFFYTSVVLGNTLYWLVFFSCAGYLIYLACLPRIKTKRYFKHMRKHYDGVIPETRVICTEDDIAVWFGKDCNHLSYDKITKIHFYKNIIRLQAGKVMNATLLQDAFTKGTKEKFVEFLHAKCPNLKMPK